MDALFLAFLNQHDAAAWLRVIDRLEPAIHPVDRVATRIWFHFHPLALDQAMTVAEDPEDLARQLVLRGRWRLADQIDTSHGFLYGHRYWPDVRNAVLAYATRGTAPSSLDLGAQTREVAREVGRERGVDDTVLVGIAAIALRTLQQVGVDQMAAAKGSVSIPERLLRSSPAEMLSARARDDRQGLFGWLRGHRRRWTVTFEEDNPDARFPLVHSQHLTTAAALDTRDYRAQDPRCSEGPIPVQCRSCSCGTCWVGVLGGAEKLSEMDSRERDKLTACGYIDTREARSVIRLACQAQAFGAVSIVIPPWCGQLGRAFKNESTAARTRSG